MKKITLIIGAGANKEIHNEIGLGSDLIKDIADRVTDRTSDIPYLSKMINDQLGIDSATREKFVGHLELYRRLAENPSIDGFLYEVDSFPEFKSIKAEFTNVGRVSIIFHVLGWEGTGTRDNIILFQKRNVTWCSEVAGFIRRHGLLNDSSFNVITFNYDRILERFLIEEFGDDATEFMDKNIFHVYGRVGYFDGLKPRKDELKADFGMPNNRLKDIRNLKGQIQLIHDRVNDNHLEIIRRIIKASDAIVVFGFGLDSVNNSRLALSNWNIDRDKEERNFFFNIYTGLGVDFDFTYRRQMMAKIRNIVTDPKICFETSQTFVRDSLRQLET